MIFFFFVYTKDLHWNIFQNIYLPKKKNFFLSIARNVDLKKGASPPTTYALKIGYSLGKKI